jgi:hypothetical protein
MAKFSDLYNEILPQVRGADEPIVDYNIRRVARDFLKATTLWRESIPVTLKAGMVDYVLVPNEGGLVAGILNLPRVDDASRTMNEINQGSQPPATYMPEAGKPDGYWQLYPGTFTVNRPPDVDYPITVDVYKQPTQDPDDDFLPDSLVEYYYEPLAAGVLARLMAMPTKPWRDTTLATFFNTEYTKAKFAARAHVRNGAQRNNQRIQAPIFAGRGVRIRR